MKWSADQRIGFFGYSPRTKKHAAQPRHMCVVDIDEALESSSDVLGLWFKSRGAPDVPLFSGGSLDAWPAWALDAFGACRDEERAVDDYLRAEATYG